MREALAHYDAERWEAAIAAFQRELAERPSNAEAWYKLGNIRTEQGADEQARASFQRAIELDPSHARAWNNVGAAHQRLGREEEALAAYRKALELDPALAQPYLNLGRLHQSRGELDRAAAYFREGLARNPGDPMLTHLLAAVARENPERAPAEHVVAYFDDFARHFDAHLGALGYRVPELLAQALLPRLRAGDRVLDLGCGTGLVGQALSGHGLELAGVDLSPGMLAQARERGVYAELLVADIEQALRSTANAAYRAVLAADVFIYLGDLSKIFPETARALAPGGFFAFSIEETSDADYRLLPNGRFAHSLPYLRRLAASCGLRELAATAIAVRRESTGVAAGRLLLLERL